MTELKLDFKSVRDKLKAFLETLGVVVLQVIRCIGIRGVDGEAPVLACNRCNHRKIPVDLALLIRRLERGKVDRLRLLPHLLRRDVYGFVSHFKSTGLIRAENIP